MSSTIGDLIVKLRLDNSGLNREAKSAERTLSNLKSAAMASLAGWASIQGVKAFWGTLLDSVETYQMAVVQTSAMVTGMMKEESGRSLSSQYQEATQYAKGLVSTLEVMDAKTILNAQDLQLINRELLKQGILLDVNNEKQVQGLTNIANAVAVISAGAPNKSIQLMQETRALLQGEVNMYSQLASMLNAQVGNLKEQVDLHRQQGDLLEWLGFQLRGFAAAGKDLEFTWEAIGSTMETIYRRTIRGGLTVAFNDILTVMRSMSDWAKEHQMEIETYLAGAWDGVKAVVKEVHGVYKSISDFADAHPFMAELAKDLTLIGAGLIAINAALKTTIALMGVMKAISVSLFTAMVAPIVGVSSALNGITFAAVAASGALGALGAAAGVVGFGFAGWQIGTLINQWEIAGKTVGEYIQLVMAGVDKASVYIGYLADRIAITLDTIWRGLSSSITVIVSELTASLNNIPGIGNLISDDYVASLAVKAAAAQEVLGGLAAAQAAEVDLAEQTRDKKLAFVDQIIEGINAEAAARNAVVKTAEDAAANSIKVNKIASDDQVKLLAKWETTLNTYRLTDTQKELYKLQQDYAMYLEHVEDKNALDEWYYHQKQVLMAKELGELAALYQDLYKATGLEKYAQAAINAYQSVLDVHEETWKQMGLTEEDAHSLRLTREQEYVKSVYDSLNKIVNAEKKAADARIGIANDISDAQSSGSGTGGDFTSAGSIFTSYKGSSYGPFSSYSEADSYMQRLISANKEAADSAFNLSNSFNLVSSAADQLASQMERELEARQRELEQKIREYGGTAETLGEFISSLGLSDFAPVIPEGGFEARYQELLDMASSDQEKVGDFLTFVQDYLDYQQMYTGGINYTGIFGKVMEDLTGLSDLYGVMATLTDMGFEGTTQELQKFIEALEKLNISIPELAGAMGIADGGTEGLVLELQNTETPFTNVIKALDSMASATKEELTDAAAMWDSLVSGIGGGMSDIASGIQGAYNNAQANPTYTPTVVTIPWVKEVDSFLSKMRWVAKYAGKYIDSTQWYSSYTDPPAPMEWVVAGSGTLTSGLTMAGEIGPEWVVPTYEPQRSKFLNDVGANPDVIASAVMSKIGGGGGDMVLEIDGKIMGKIMADELTKNPGFIVKMRRQING